MVFFFHLKNHENTVILQLVSLLSVLKEAYSLLIEHLTLNWVLKFFPMF